MNLFKNGVFDYILTGHWSKKPPSKKLRCTAKPTSSPPAPTRTSPTCRTVPNLNLSENADYFWMCENETIGGTTMFQLPNAKGHVLVSDSSSCFLSQPMDVTKFGLIFAGAQKNVGPAGVVIVIVREDLIQEDVFPGTPTMLKYKIHADNGSMYNTPPCYPIYICGLVFKWLLSIGGLEEMKKRNDRKSQDLVRLSRSISKLVQGHRRQSRPLAHERHLHDGIRRTRRQVRQGGEVRRLRQPEGSPLRRRPARLDLQRDAQRRRRSFGLLHESFRNRCIVK
ncbi:MAG: aminotransferase class V-fold PLP-dependent enzyme [Bacillus subtilis]|nr:aminotransferase class V-fold PLP-dependent enzyme [Bacillus subtilis]